MARVSVRSVHFTSSLNKATSGTVNSAQSHAIAVSIKNPALVAHRHIHFLQT